MSDPFEKQLQADVATAAMIRIGSSINDLEPRGRQENAGREHEAHKIVALFEKATHQVKRHEADRPRTYPPAMIQI